ncbi:MAG: hypothetical protein RB191_02220 [Terriglobia bacterium]|nr:hypothetical protein [Terriglobia bacterium]
MSVHSAKVTKAEYDIALTHIAALRTSIRELLDCYWGSGDGETPPEFVKRAARLSGWKHKGR